MRQFGYSGGGKWRERTFSLLMPQPNRVEHERLTWNVTCAPASGGSLDRPGGGRRSGRTAPPTFPIEARRLGEMKTGNSDILPGLHPRPERLRAQNEARLEEGAVRNWRGSPRINELGEYGPPTLAHELNPPALGDCQLRPGLDAAPPAFRRRPCQSHAQRPWKRDRAAVRCGQARSSAICARL